MQAAASRLYLWEKAELLALSQNASFRALPYFDPDGFFDMHRDGPSSYVLTAPSSPEYILKVRKNRANPAVMPYQDEYNLIGTLQTLRSKDYTLPTAYAVGSNPGYLVMNRLGPDYTASRSLRETYLKNGRAIGQRIGAFAADLFLLNGGVHTDLHPNNITHESDYTTGIIDIAGINNKCTTLIKPLPEKMLTCPIAFNPDLALSLAETFSTRTGHLFKLFIVEKCSLNTANSAKSHPESYERCTRNHASFMEAARKMPNVFKIGN